jgi:hypothetical protein
VLSSSNAVAVVALAELVQQKQNFFFLSVVTACTAFFLFLQLRTCGHLEMGTSLW